MPLFILTDQNVALAKAALRATMPDVRSAHLTEAIAFGLGFNTNAALRDAISLASKYPDVAQSNRAAFSKRLAALGYASADPGLFDAALAEPILADTPFTLFKRGDRTANDRHYYACQKRGRPMIMVKVARLYAELEWDAITVDTSEEDYLHDAAGSELTRILFALFQARAAGAPGKPIFFGSAFTGTITKLLPATACQLAEDYFRLLYLPLRQQRGPRRRAA